MRNYVLTAVFAILALLQGCSKTPECPEVTTTVYDDLTVVEQGPESYACSPVGNMAVLEQTWCEAQAQFEKRDRSLNSEDFPMYLKGFREGYVQASQADDSRLSLFDITFDGASQTDAHTPKAPPYDVGYRDGYLAIMDAMGIFEYNCGSPDLTSEYKDRWCEAADAYRTSGGGSGNNPFTKGRFIDGYMTGGRVALTVPTSMEAFFGGETPEGRQPAIVRPSGELKSTEVAFYQGFDVGYKAMIDSIRESINQVMQQIQIPNNMDFPEGLMPPPPGQ